MQQNSKPSMFWTNEKRKLSDLKPWERNPRQIKDKQAKLLAESFSDFGQVETIAISANGDIYNGHQRLSVLAGKYGMDYEVDVRVSSRDLTEKERERLTVYLHRGATGEWDFDELANWDMSDLLTWGFEEGDFPFDVAPALNEGADAEPQIDKAEELRQKWDVQSGQMWQLGEHRIICGDCTDRAVVERVMGGEKINVCVTSPPYASQRKYDESSGFVPIHPDKYAEWWKPVQDAIKQHLATDGSFFLNIKEHCEDGQRSLYVKDLTISHVRDWSWRFVDEFCWVRSGVPGKWPNRFKNGFEPIFHFCINENIKFRGEAVGHESDDLLRYSPDNPKTHSGFLSSGGGGNGRIHGIALPNNVLSISTARSDKDRGHTAEFPVDLPSFFIKAFSDKFDAIYEPFSGSGTTIIACENLSRKCRAVEISPAYVAVAIQRWVDVTGKEPILLDA